MNEENTTIVKITFLTTVTKTMIKHGGGGFVVWGLFTVKLVF